MRRIGKYVLMRASEHDALTKRIVKERAEADRLRDGWQEASEQNFTSIMRELDRIRAILDGEWS